MEMTMDGKIRLAVANGDGTYRVVELESNVPVIKPEPRVSPVDHEESCSLVVHARSSIHW